MAHGRQHSEWIQTLSIHAAIGNLFASKGDQVEVRKMIPAHVLGPEPRRRQPSEAELKQNWSLLRSRVRGQRHGRQ